MTLGELLAAARGRIDRLDARLLLEYAAGCTHADLLARPNFLLTPHVAWSSRPAMQEVGRQVIANIEAFVAGTPRNQVT